MRVLCVYCGPLPESFLAALRQETFAGRFAFGPSLRTEADRERQQRIGYDAFAEPTMNERYLRI